MPDGTIDIYIDSSFFSVDPGTDDVYTTFIAAPAENIGLRDTGADYQLALGISGVVGYPVEVYTSYSGAFQDGYISTITRYETNATMSGVVVSLVDYAVPTSTSGLSRTEDVDLNYFTGLAKISGSLDANVGFTGGQLYLSSDNIFSYFHSEADEVVEDDYEADYTAGGEYNPLIPGPPEDQVITLAADDYAGYFTMGSDTNSGTIQEECELFLAGYPLEFHPDKYTYKFHLAAGLEGSKQGAEWEAEVISGAVLDIPFDILSTATTSGFYNFGSICGLVDLVSYSFNSEVVSGTIDHYFGEIISSVSGTNGYTFDVDLLSLKISNFSLDIDEYTPASGTICVDITDDVHNVTPSGSYFIIDETITSGTSFIPITDGYTMCYDSPTDFDSILGATTFTVHAANDNGDILERDFYVTSGYVVEYNNLRQDYGFGNQVVVRASAENLASCPNTGVDAYFFTSIPKLGVDLGASIVGQPWGVKDLSAEIVPTTDTIYFYGKTFRIEIRAKDFAGNVMKPFTFEFKIEDKPE